MASKSTRLAGAREWSKSMTLVGHGPSFYMLDGKRSESQRGPVIAYFPDGQKMISGSEDRTTRVWDLQAGKEIEEARVVCEPVRCVVVSRDGRWVITQGQGKLKACDMKNGITKTFNHQSLRSIHCINVSMDSKLLVSGSWDTIWIWSLDTGKLVADPFKSVGDVRAVQFSRDSRKLAAISRDSLDVWDIEAQKLDVRVVGHASEYGLDVPVFWTTKDRTIVAAFNFSGLRPTRRIYEFDASTLETVRAPFEGHTHYISGLALSFDCALLVSASYNTIKLWAFESRQLLASFDTQWFPWTLILSPDARQVAYTTSSPSPHKIYICDIPSDILANIWPSTNAQKIPRISDALDSQASATTRSAMTKPASASFMASPLRHSPTIQYQQFSVLCRIRKLLPSFLRKNAESLARTVEPHDPLDCPATSPRLLSRSSPAPATTLIHSSTGENSRPTSALPISQPSASASASTIIRSRLHNLSNCWRPIHIGHALPLIVSVPLAHGKERIAAAGAPKGDDGCRPDEDFDSRPSSPNSDSQQALSAPAQGTTGEHGSGRSCFCL